MKPTYHPPSDIDATLDLDEFEEFEELEVEWGLPLRAANFINGIPQVTVDYYDLDDENRDTVSGRMSGLVGADGRSDFPDETRYYFVDSAENDDRFRPQDIVGIAVLRDACLRLETNIAWHTSSLRAAIEQSLGDLIRHRLTQLEDPLAQD